jgi:hypothetical protein
VSSGLRFFFWNRRGDLITIKVDNSAMSSRLAPQGLVLEHLAYRGICAQFSRNSAKSKEDSMRQAIAVTGYLSDQAAQKLAAKHPGLIEIKPEPGPYEVVVRVDGVDVEEVRTGSSTHGETLVQLILRPDAPVQTVVHALASTAGLERLQDPILGRLTASAAPKVIMV